MDDWPAGAIGAGEGLSAMLGEAIIADDLTGAGDSGVHFALAGKPTALLLDHNALAEALRDHQAVALSSESRFLGPEAAAAAARRAADRCRAAGVRIAFKKIDSTLRGNLGAEIEAVLDAGGGGAALVCPAMPKTGRVCRNGVLLLHGGPVHETAIGRDPFNPLPCSSVAGMLAAQTRLPFANLGLEAVHSGAGALRNAVGKMLEAGKRLIVADAETDADLAALGKLLREANRIRGFPALLPVGAGGLAEAVAGSVRLSSGPELRGRMLAVVGSLAEASLSQIASALASGAFHPLELDMGLAFENPAGEVSRLVAELPDAGKRHLLLKNRALPRPGKSVDAGDGIRAAGIFGEAARAVCLAGGCSLLYVAGGSTAAAVAASLGLRRLTLERECLPGVVFSSCPGRGAVPRWFVSKAGGFGDSGVIVKIAAGISRDAPPLRPDAAGS
jgi:uncharacterized protein YgbK (DUF1537 family)